MQAAVSRFRNPCYLTYLMPAWFSDWLWKLALFGGNEKGAILDEWTRTHRKACGFDSHFIHRWGHLFSRDDGAITTLKMYQLNRLREQRYSKLNWQGVPTIRVPLTPYVKNNMIVSWKVNSRRRKISECYRRKGRFPTKINEGSEERKILGRLKPKVGMIQRHTTLNMVVNWTDWENNGIAS